MSHRTRTAALVASLALAACSGGGDSNSPQDGTDYSSNFVGVWEGSMTVTSGGSSSTSPYTYSSITRTGVNALVVGFCDDQSGPSAEVLSASSFHIGGVTCQPVPVSTCAAVTIIVDPGGTGNLANGQLVMAMSGSMSGCGQIYRYTMTFNGSRTSTTPLALTAEGETVHAALEALAASYF